jgi:hypothetical protein
MRASTLRELQRPARLNLSQELSPLGRAATSDDECAENVRVAGVGSPPSRTIMLEADACVFGSAANTPDATALAGGAAPPALLADADACVPAPDPRCPPRLTVRKRQDASCQAVEEPAAGDDDAWWTVTEHTSDCFEFQGGCLAPPGSPTPRQWVKLLHGCALQGRVEGRVPTLPRRTTPRRPKVWQSEGTDCTHSSSSLRD